VRHAALAVAMIALATLSCQIILGLEAPTGTPAAVEEPDTGPIDPCRHSLPPKKGKDDDPDTKKTYWFATKAVAAPLPPGQGYDLDNACTCQPDLHDGGPACTNAKTVCDVEGGIDDAVGVLFGSIASTLPFDPLKPVNSNLQSGARTLLLYLTDYNGRPNDADVTVGFVNSGGMYTDVGCDDVTPRGLEVTFGDDGTGTHTPIGRNRYRPAQDGCDHWSPQEALVVQGSRIPVVRVPAYVVNSQLVIMPGIVSTSVFGAGVSINDSLFVATIVQEDGHLRLDGVLAGRLPFDDLIQTLGGNETGSFGSSGAHDAGDYTAACEVPLIWNQAIPRLCAARDTMASEAEDFSAKPRACNATSLNFGFTMVEAKLADFDFTNKALSKTCPQVTCP
jgi:hypothetical protein